MSPIKAPRPKPSDVGSPVPQSAPPSPEEQLVLDDAFARMEAPPAGAPPAEPPAEGISPEEQLVLDAALAAEGQGPVPSAGPSPTPMSAEGAPIAEPPLTEMPALGRVKVKFGKTPTQQQQIAQTVLGANYETAIQDEEIVFRAKGSPEWRPVDPKLFSSAGEFFSDVLDFAPEIVETGASFLGTAIGAMVGLVGGPGGSVAGAAAGGAAGGALSAGVREAALRMMGAEGSESLGTDVALSTGFGALGGAAGQWLFRKPVSAASAKIRDSVSKGEVARATAVSNIQQEFNTIYSWFTGKPHATMGEAGKHVGKLIETEHRAMGEMIDLAWSTAETANPTKKFAPANMVQHVQKELAEYFHAVPVPPTKPGGRVMMELKPFREVPDDVKGYYTRLKQLYGQLVNDGGFTVKQYRDTLQQVKSWANFGTRNPGIAENSWRTADKVFAKERDILLEQAVKGSEVEGLVARAFSDYRTNIDAVRELAKAAEKAPEKFAKKILADSKSASIARDTLNLTEDGKAAWDALRSTWLKTHVEKHTDKRTGIVKLSEMAKSLRKDADMVETVLGEGTLQQFEALATRMDRVTWQGLLANPDTSGNTGIIRALGKFVLNRDNPVYGANLLGAIAGYEPRVLKLVQEKGILSFAKEAKTLNERNHWLKAANALDKLIQGSTVHVNGKPVAIEPALITTLLRAGTRDATDSPEDVNGRQVRAKEALDEYLARQQTSQEKTLSERNAR